MVLLQHKVFAVVWLYGQLLLLLTPVATGNTSSSPCPRSDSSLPPSCKALSRVCVDHSVFVLYENKHNPRHELYTGLPDIHLPNITLNYFGFDDVWGTEFKHAGLTIRPATAGEETKELSHPQFTRCSVPLVIYANSLYRYSNFFVNTVATLHMMQLNRTLDKRLSLVVETYGMQLESFHRFLLSPFGHYRVTTLSHLSSRLPLERAEAYNPDGQHVRCFRQLLVCQMTGTASSAAAALSTTSSMPEHPVWSTGQAIFHYYKYRLPPIDPSFADKTKLRVLIAAVQRRNKMRAMVNQDQVWSWCRKFKPPQGVQDWNGTTCLLHEFGRNHMSDLAYASQADVVLGLHGDSLYSAFFMAKHSSVVEIRPRGFSGAAARKHLQEVTRADGDSILWWGINIVNPAHSAPGVLETQKRGMNHTWARDRHVYMRLMACQYIMERIALARNNPGMYRQFRQRKEHFITDLLEPAEDEVAKS